ncbi:polysaccharide pyruvyl transferase family protein [Pseudomonas sp. MWU12-2345]|uniref:polysaccharide pyruvyl transferase family protein n=1 Tax=Pseudomonas sp. MWU12-2345 TaxID=2928689 RepID=UPI00200D5BA9|nr:polysaccharide pyruvyl transferase family protein [Pseudomonas sp. MWU12-2345]
MKIAQIGTFDLDNLGDLLFPWVTEKLIHLVCGSRSTVEICFYSPTRPEAYLYPDQVPYAAISQLDHDDAVAPFDFILMGGGDLIRNDDYSLYQVYGENSPELTFTQILSPTQTNSRRLALLAVGLPYDVDDVFSVFLTNSFSRVVSAGVRDVRSAKLLEEHTGVSYAIVPDFVHSLPYVLDKAACESMMSDVLAGYDGGYLCFQGHADVCASVEDVANVLKEIEKALDKPFVLIEIGGCLGDTEYLRELATVTGYPFISRVTHPGITIEQKISVLACSSGFIGSSLHGNIISNAYGINNVSYVGKYSHKISEYFSEAGHGVLFEDFSALKHQIHTVLDCLLRDTSDKAALIELKYKKIMLFLEELLQSDGKELSSFSIAVDRLYKAAHGQSCARESIVRDQLASQEAQLRAEKMNAAEQINYRDLLIRDLETLLSAEKKNAVEQINYRDLLIKAMEEKLLLSEQAEKK